MTKDMTEGDPARLILGFTLPLIAGNVFQQLYAFVDTLIVGRILGVGALAAVGCTGSIMFLLLGFVMGLTGGFSICTGQRFGAKDKKGVRQSMAACLLLSLVFSLLLTLIGFFGCRGILIIMDTPAEILDGAYDFISIVCLGCSMFVFLMMQTNVLRSLGDSRMPTVILAAALILNIILEPIAIMVFGWGIPGAAIATIASQGFGNLICYLYIRRKVPDLWLKWEDFRLTKKIIMAHLKIGLPMGIQTSIIAIGAVVVQSYLNDLGKDAVAAFAAAQKVDALAMMPVMSFGTAMAAYTAQNFGAKKWDRISEGVKKCILMSVSFALLAGGFLILCGGEIMELFVGADQKEVIAYGRTFFNVGGMCYWMVALLFIFRFTLQGLGESFAPTFAGFMELFMRVAVAVFLVDKLGFLGVCLASPFAWLGAAVPLGIAFYRKKKRMLRQIEVNGV